jgi:hypothetical protein
MTPEREPVDDAALIAEIIAQAEKEYEADTFTSEGQSYYVARRALELQREGWQPPAPEPDRATLVTREMLAMHEGLAYSDEYLKGCHDRDLTFQAARAVIAKALKPDVPSIPGWLHDWARKALSGIFIYNPNISDEVDKQINDTMRAAEQIDEWAKVEKQLIDGAGVRAILRVAGEKM